MPRATTLFWLVVLLCPTVSAATTAYLTSYQDVGLAGRSLYVATLAAVVLTLQLSYGRRTGLLYWASIVVASGVSGVLAANLSEHLGVSPGGSCAVLAAALAATFSGWFLVERSVSVDAVFTARREGFYWIATILSLALGAALRELFDQELSYGPGPAALILASMILVVGCTWWKLGLSSSSAFWSTLVLATALGGSLGKLVSGTRRAGGLGLGTTITDVLFLAVMIGLVGYLVSSRSGTAGGGGAGSPGRRVRSRAA